ncbi:hypothetical protein, partial [Mycolicibacterium mucogenicum]|uniref:hypothetical protein n=1 Tax=Mycolicibacterium mucogenicum TaxID=56689 RepID=UPI001F1EF1E7
MVADDQPPASLAINVLPRDALRMSVANWWRNECGRTFPRNCQYLWIGLFQATSVPVDSVGAES